MARLHFRNVEHDTVNSLKEPGPRGGGSAEAESRETIRAALEWHRAPVVDIEDWMRRAAEFRESLKGRYHTPSEVLLRESRDER